jgi:hypothetical protein
MVPNPLTWRPRRETNAISAFHHLGSVPPLNGQTYRPDLDIRRPESQPIIIALTGLTRSLTSLSQVRVGCLTVAGARRSKSRLEVKVPPRPHHRRCRAKVSFEPGPGPIEQALSTSPIRGTDEFAGPPVIPDEHRELITGLFSCPLVTVDASRG